MDILINGQSTGYTTPNATFTFNPFSINGGFVAGVNTLDFVVFNEGGPMGLRVEMSGTAVPEPASASVVAAAAGLSILRRRPN